MMIRIQLPAKRNPQPSQARMIGETVGREWPLATVRVMKAKIDYLGILVTCGPTDLGYMPERVADQVGAIVAEVTNGAYAPCDHPEAARKLYRYDSGWLQEICSLCGSHLTPAAPTPDDDDCGGTNGPDCRCAGCWTRINETIQALHAMRDAPTPDGQEGGDDDVC